MLGSRLGALLALVLCASCQPAPAEEAPPMKSRVALLRKLERAPRFMIGHGNDLPGAEKNFDFKQAGIYTLPAALDIHYVYLSGVKDEPYYRGGPGWPDYNPNGAFVTTIAKNAIEKNVLPMFTLYMSASRGEQNFDAFRDPEFMGRYWASVRILFERLAELDKPALVHVEPDWWGHAQDHAGGNDDPAATPVALKSHVPECRDLPADVSGMGRCIIRLARKIAPKVAIGLHASGFGHRGRPDLVAQFLRKCGASEGDFIVLETLDRDAGCFEAKQDPECQRDDGDLYWDITGQGSPNPHEHLAWVEAIHQGLGLPVMWWQMPLGVPSDAPGGTTGRYRDNRVQYFFDHVPEFEQVGGFAAAFGIGAPNQTTIATDEGQFARATLRYYQRPLNIVRP